VWFAIGNVEIGGDFAIPFGLNKARIMGDESVSYVSMDVDLLLGFRHVWR
jgi:hypothetical protein